MKWQKGGRTNGREFVRLRKLLRVIRKADFNTLTRLIKANKITLEG